MVTSLARDVIEGTLVDLAATQGTEFADILIPQADLGAAKVGITEQFLANAGDWAQRYAAVPYFQWLIESALKDRLKAPPGAVLDIGSGSGNSVLPVLSMFPEARIIATDLSEALLAILRDHVARDPAARRRLELVCIDATRADFKPNSVDLVIGAAILHHLIDPAPCVWRACRALRPNGLAVFFEPFEAGCSILRLAYEQILNEDFRRSEGRLEPRVADMLRALVTDFRVRSGCEKSDPIFQKIDDKWLFTRDYFEGLAKTIGNVTVAIEPVFESDELFTRQTRTFVSLSLGVTVDEAVDYLPKWAWNIVGALDAAFSPALRRDLPIEAKIIFQRNE